MQHDKFLSFYRLQPLCVVTKSVGCSLAAQWDQNISNIKKISAEFVVKVAEIVANATKNVAKVSKIVANKCGKSGQNCGKCNKKVVKVA